jgi:hypothetical protein
MSSILRAALMAAAIGVVLALPACSTMATSQETCAACGGKGCEKCATTTCKACGGKGCEACMSKTTCKACGGKGCAKCKPQ